MPRKLVWFSCGAPSAVTAKLAIEKYGDVEVLYCDTLKYEHPDNYRFLQDVEKWIGQPIIILKSTEYTDIFDVFERTKFLVSPKGARCTTEMKKKVRMAYQQPDDIHCFGYTLEEHSRIETFKKHNPELHCDWIVYDRRMSKRQCQLMIADAGIELPMMYRLGYRNNNCIGCVKGGAGYWNKIRDDFPAYFDRMAEMERKLGVAICSISINGSLQRVFLDELPRGVGDYPNEPDISCGVQCNLF